MQTPLLIIGGLVLLLVTFYVAREFEYWKHVLYTSRHGQTLETGPDKYPGVSSDELIKQAFEAERRGDIQNAVERFLAARQKNPSYRDILFHVGQIRYENGKFDEADKLFEHAIAFGEDVAAANHSRGLIAVRHKNLAAAQRHFGAAAAADPFTAEYHYSWAEALRMDYHPKEAMARYEHAALLARHEKDRSVCQFKIRMARLEAADATTVAAEVEKQRAEGDLSVDWLMTAAALEIRQAGTGEGTRLIEEARARNQASLFVPCVTDMFFANAASKLPDIAQACHPEIATTSP